MKSNAMQAWEPPWLSSLGCDNLSTLIVRCLFLVERVPPVPYTYHTYQYTHREYLHKRVKITQVVNLPPLCLPSETANMDVSISVLVPASERRPEWPPSSRLAAQAFPAFQERYSEPFSIPRLKPLHQLCIAMLSLEQKVAINSYVAYVHKIS